MSNPPLSLLWGEYLADLHRYDANLMVSLDSVSDAPIPAHDCRANGCEDHEDSGERWVQHWVRACPTCYDHERGEPMVWPCPTYSALFLRGEDEFPPKR